MTPDQTSAALGIKRYFHLTVNRDSRHRLSTLFEKYTVGVIVLLLEYQMTTWARSVRWEPSTGQMVCLRIVVTVMVCAELLPEGAADACGDLSERDPVQESFQGVQWRE